MESESLKVEQLGVKLGGMPILKQISFSLATGQSLAVTGNTGTGKTTLLKALAAQIFSTGSIHFRDVNGHRPKLILISRQHHFTNRSNLSSFYYQQRFNSFDSEDAYTAEQELRAMGANEAEITATLKRFGILHIRQEPLIQLSNGEHKRFQIAKAILQHADWLLLDNPFTGLDIAARATLSECLDELVRNGVQMILVTGPSDIPSMITHVAILEDGRMDQIMPADAFRKAHTNLAVPASIDQEKLRSVKWAYRYPDFEFAVKMVNTSITYQHRKILDNINWQVKKGEHWNLAGHNGSGKSTLLSLINGDNPQAFANEIYLFDRRKGSGESIWDIKRKTGFVSPELHHYFETGTSCVDLVASGLFDTMGLFRKLNPEQEEITEQWMALLHITKFNSRSFQTLSDGEQRKVLLARALVKNPPLLLLDEPCQGLDEIATYEFTRLINDICTTMSKTLIYVSHYSAELPACINKRLLLEQGRVVF